MAVLDAIKRWLERNNKHGPAIDKEQMLEELQRPMHTVWDVLYEVTGKPTFKTVADFVRTKPEDIGSMVGPLAIGALAKKVKAVLEPMSHEGTHWLLVKNQREIDDAIRRAIEAKDVQLLPKVPVEYYFGKGTALPGSPYPGVSFRGASADEFDYFLRTGKTGSFWTGNPAEAFYSGTPAKVMFAAKAHYPYDPIYSPEDNAVRLLEDVYAVWQPQPYEATGYVGVHGIKPIWVNSKADVKQLQKLFNTILREKDFWRYAQRREQRKR